MSSKKASFISSPEKRRRRGSQSEHDHQAQTGQGTRNEASQACRAVHFLFRTRAMARLAGRPATLITVKMNILLPSAHKFVFSDRLSRSSAEGSSNLTVRASVPTLGHAAFNSSGCWVLTHTRTQQLPQTKRCARKQQCLCKAGGSICVTRTPGMQCMHKDGQTDARLLCCTPCSYGRHVCISAESGSNPQPETLEVESLAKPRTNKTCPILSKTLHAEKALMQTPARAAGRGRSNVA